jgi:ribosome-binding protein aMBF1 (putative translation factor)
MSNQDWEPVTIRKKFSYADALKSTKKQVGTRKHNAGKNPSNKLNQVNANKLDNGELFMGKEMPDFNMRKHMQQARTEKGWKQKEIAQKLNITAKEYQDYESGKTVPKGRMLDKLNRLLGVSLKKKTPKKKTPPRRSYGRTK